MIKSSSSDCIFCDPNPCGCNSKKKTSPSVRKKLPGSVAIRSTVKSVVKPVVKSTASTAPRKATPRPVAVDPELELSRAITVLAEAGLLPAEELIKHKEKLQIPKQKIAVLIWRQQRSAEIKK